MGIIEFLFGKKPKIQVIRWTVRHDIGEKRWAEWRDRFEKNPKFNWKNHVGKVGKNKKFTK